MCNLEAEGDGLDFQVIEGIGPRLHFIRNALVDHPLGAEIVLMEEALD